MTDAEKIAEIIAKNETLSVQKDLEEIVTEIETVIAIENAIAVGETTKKAAIGVARGAAHEIVRETEIDRGTAIETGTDPGTSAIGRGIATETEALEEATEDRDRDRAIEIDTVDDDYFVKLNCHQNLNFCSNQNMLKKSF